MAFHFSVCSGQPADQLLLAALHSAGNAALPVVYLFLQKSETDNTCHRQSGYRARRWAGLSTGVVAVPDDLDLPAGEWRRISIFMNVFDVHVNRTPVSGEVVATSYHRGQFLNASLDKASEKNERQNMVLRCQDGQSIGVVQIAGLVARQILLETAVGDHLLVGQQFGIIRFGSRVDVWVPASMPVPVLAGQKTIAGETVIADMSGVIPEPAQMSER